jgi:hypothetical protein
VWVPLALGLDIFGDAGRFRDHKAIGSKAFDMEPDRVANIAFDRRNRVTGSNAALQVRYIGRIIAVGFLDDDRVAHQGWSFRPDCVKILFSVTNITIIFNSKGQSQDYGKSKLKSSKQPMLGLNMSSTEPVTPFRCFAIISSARPYANSTWLTQFMCSYDPGDGSSCIR